MLIGILIYMVGFFASFICRVCITKYGFDKRPSQYGSEDWEKTYSAALFSWAWFIAPLFCIACALIALFIIILNEVTVTLFD